MSSASSLPVVVVGAGPVGLSLALALRRAGMDVSVLDHRPGIPRDHRATTIQPRTLEMFAEWGVLDAVLQAGVRVERLHYWERSGSPKLLADLDYRHIERDTACPYRVHLDQWTTCDILLEALESGHRGTVSWGHKVLGFEDHGDHVTATAMDREQRMFVHRASVLVAADGHSSSIRERLGVHLAGSAAPTGFMSAFAPLDVLDGHSFAPVSYLYDDAGWTMLMVMADQVRLLFQAPTDRASSDAMSAAATGALARRWLGPGAEGKLRSLALYTVRPGVAPQWRAGRVVLVGDAAHSAYPVGGTAMNCGIHDAHVLAGALRSGADAALDAYAASRRAWASEHLVDRATESLRALSARGMWNRASRGRHLRALASDPAKARAHLLRLSMLEDRI